MHLLLLPCPLGVSDTGLHLEVVVLELLLLESTDEVEDLVEQGHGQVDVEELVHMQLCGLAVRLLVLFNLELDSSSLHERLEEVQILVEIVHFQGNSEADLGQLTIRLLELVEVDILGLESDNWGELAAQQIQV